MTDLSHLNRTAKNPEGFDPDTSLDLMAEALKAKITVNPAKIEEVRREMQANESTSKKNKYIDEYLGRTPAAPQSVNTPPPSINLGDVNVEGLLINLHDLYDGLIDVFQRIGLNHDVSNLLTEQIDLTTSVIRKIGGSIEDFVPEDNVSGLEMPNLEENAQKVLQNTKKCYRLGTINESSVHENGSTIKIVFSGEVPSKGIKYVASGVVMAGLNGWTGSEAIDYVYRSGGGGKMSVRAYEDGKWVNKSDQFRIAWDLDEKEIGEVEEQADEEIPTDIIEGLTPAEPSDFEDEEGSTEFRP